MIYILISWIFNGFLLSLSYVLVFRIIDKHAVRTPEEYLLLGYATIILLTIFGVSKLGNYLLKFFIGCRAPIESEQQKINFALGNTLEVVNKLKATKYNLKKFTILITDSILPNSYAFGSNTIILSSGLLKISNEKELEAILAHEVGFLYNMDSQVIIAFIYSNLATKVIMLIYDVYLELTKVLSKLSNKSNHDGLQLLMLLILVPLIVFLPFVLIRWFMDKVLNLILGHMNKKSIYNADKFATNVGYKKDLISFLEKINLFNLEENSIINKILKAYPSPIERIQHIES